MNFIHDRNKTAFIYKDKNYSYRDMIEMAKLYSTQIEIEKGDFVVVYTENRPEFAGAILGIWEKKGTSVNIDSGYNAEQVAFVLKDTDSKYMFTSEKNYETAMEGKRIADSDVVIIKFEDIIKPQNFKVDRYEIKGLDADDVAVMLYTSGTTGSPKGVLLTFDNLMSNVDAIKDINLVNEEDRLLGILPFYHILPLTTNVLMPLHFGCLVVIVDELSSESLKYNLKTYEITLVIGVPRVWEMFHKGIMSKINSNKIATLLFNICSKVNNKALSKKIFKQVQEGFGGHIRLLASGGAKLDPQIAKDFNTLGFTLIEGYGLTETSPIISFNKPEDIVPGSVGSPIPGVTVKIAEDGEIIVKGRNVMKGYYNRPEAMVEAIDKDGWFHTGDMGTIEDGKLFIVGRKKELIVLSNGKKINPTDVEIEIMKGTDLIQEIAITDYQDHLVAIIYPNFEVMEQRKIANIKEALKWEIIDKYNVTAPKYRKILDIKIVKEELPKTKLGKLRRFMLKDLLIGDDAVVSEEKEVPKEKIKSQSSVLNTTEYVEIKKYLEKLHDTDVTPESYLEIDLGLDSLDIVELIAFIEKTFGVDIHEEDFSKIKTVEQLCVYVKEKGGDYREGEINWQKIFDEPIECEMPKSATATKVIKLMTAPIFSTYFKLKKEGQENISRGPVIYAGNHQSFLDAFALNQILPNSVIENTYYLAISIYFQSFFKKKLAEHGNILVIDINKNLKETLKIMAKVLKEGKNIVIFPEGARTRDGELQEFKKAFAILSKELNVPVVPFGIKGAYDKMPYGTKFPKSGEIDLKLFEKINPENLTVDEIVEKTRETINNWLKN